MRNHFGYLLKSLIVSLFLLLYYSPGASASQAQLAWNQSSDPSVTGYKVYYGTQSGNYQLAADVGANLSYTVANISASQTYYFAVTDYNSSVESGYSPELVCNFITAATPSNGQITPSGAIALTSGSSQTFSIVPDSGYQISSVLVDGASVAAATSYTFTNVTAGHTIAATFSPITTTYTISATAQGSGSISPAGTTNVPSGTNQSFSITPTSNYKISAVMVDGASVGVQSSYTFTNVIASHTIAATFSPITYTISATVYGSGSISPAGTTNVSSRTNQSYSITPAANYKISDVKVDGASVSALPSYTFTNVTANHAIVATFSPITYTISASVQGSGSISPSGTTSVPSGSNQPFTITPSANYKISDVKVDGASVGALPSYTFTNVTANHAIVATFSPITYTISATVQGSGSISPAGMTSVSSGSNQTLTISPSANYQISGVMVDGASVGTVSSYTFTNVTANHAIVATFSPLTYTISASVQGSGSISPAGTTSVSSGSNQTLTISPSANYQISGVMVDGASVGTVSSYTFTNVTANHVIAVTFSPAITYNISATVQGSGSISPPGTTNVPSGTNQSFTITPAANYIISDVKVDGASVGALPSYTFTNVTANHAIVATFAPGTTYTISAFVQGSGSISPSGAVKVPSGTDQTFSITPSSNYKISRLKVDGKTISVAQTYTFANVTANHSIAVSFAPVKYSISAISQGGGWISPIGTSSVTAGTSKAYTIAPAAGYKLESVMVDGQSYSPVSGGSLNVEAPEWTSTGKAAYTFTNIEADHSIHAIFLKVPPPVADAGPDQNVDSGSTVTLSGSNSTDTVSGIASYRWKQTSGPPVKLSSNSAEQCTFTAPNITSGRMLSFNLTVTNWAGVAKSASCLVNVSATDRAPSANAGAGQTVSPLASVTLDGSGSSDPDGRIVSYNWVQIQGPPVHILNANTPYASFIAPNPGSLGASLVFRLLVTDNLGLRTRDECTISVATAGTSPPVANAGLDQTVVTSTSVTLDGSGSNDPSNSTDSYRWTQIRGVPVTLSDPTAISPTFTAPADTVEQVNDMVFMLTVTDAQNELSSMSKCAVTIKTQ